MICETAPAKVNLYLHVGPVRADGLHELQSLFVFADEGDVVTAAPAQDLSLEIKGPFAGALAGEPLESNLVHRAAQALRTAFGVGQGAAIALDKRLPVAAGLGGGSADAAAALRALVRLWKLQVAEDQLARIAFALGADVPACLSRRPLQVSGAGEILKPGPPLAPVFITLVNPGVEMPTGPVFRAFDAANPAPSLPERPAIDDLSTPAALAGLFETTRNDLQPHAISVNPAIARTLDFLAESDDGLGVRMSGSGATCFALFETAERARVCARRSREMGWWAMACKVSNAA